MTQIQEFFNVIWFGGYAVKWWWHQWHALACGL